jgi:hypothetical protein
MPIDPKVRALATKYASLPGEKEEEERKEGRASEKVLEYIETLKENEEPKRQYLRERYALGMAAPYRGVRLKYIKKAMKEITDPYDQQLLVEEVARTNRTRAEAERKRASGEGLIGWSVRHNRGMQRNWEAFVDAGTGMVEAAKDLVGYHAGAVPTKEQVQFMQALEAAQQGESPLVPEYAGMAGKAAAGFSGMVPDLSASMIATMYGGPGGTMSYWTARGYGDQFREYTGMGMEPGAAAGAAWGTSAASAAVETLGQVDPTGLLKNVSKPVKTAIFRGASKHPLVRRALAGALDTLKRYGLELAEEPAQAGVERGMQATASKMVPGLEDRRFSDIPEEMWEVTKEAAGGMGALVLIGGGGRFMQSAGRFKRLAEGSKEYRRHEEMFRYLREGKTPSRRTWRKWGLDPDKGETRKQRTAELKKITAVVQGAEELRAATMKIPPTEAEWKRWGYPEGAGRTGADRLAFLRAKYQIADEANVEAETRAEAARGHVRAAQEAPAGAAAVQAETSPEAAQQAPAATEEAVRERRPVSPAERAVAFPKGRPVPGPALGHDMEVQMEEKGPATGGREVVLRLEKIFGYPLRLGRLGRQNRGARGIFKTHSGVGRLARGEEASVSPSLHELAHALEEDHKLLDGISDQAWGELKNLDYDEALVAKGEGRAEEGFAEFIVGYTSGSIAKAAGIDLERQTPTFLQEFEAWLDEHPDIREKLVASKELVTQFQDAGAVGRVMGQFSESGVDRTELEERAALGWFRGSFKFLYSRFKDEGKAVQEYDTEAKRKGYTPGEDTTAFEDYNALRRTSEHFAANALEHGVFSMLTMQKIGPSMREVLREIKPGKDYKKFRAFAYARHAQEVWERAEQKLRTEASELSPEEREAYVQERIGSHSPGITKHDAVETVKRLFDPRYERAADGLTAFNNSLVRMLAESGAIEAETAETIINYYTWYIPLHRATRKGFLRGTGRRMVNLGDVILGRKGSALKVLDPVESTLSRALKFYDRAAKQVIVNKLVKTAEDVKRLGGWIEEVPFDMIPTTFSLEEISSQLAPILETVGVDVEELLKTVDPLTALTIFRPEKMTIHGMPVVQLIVDGQRKLYWVRPELIEALGGVETHQAVDFVTRIARPLMATLKLGATRLKPSFWIRNALIDYQTFLVQGERGLGGAVDPAAYAAAYVYTQLTKVTGEKGDPVVQLWEAMGGPLSTYVGLDRSKLREARKAAVRGRSGYLEVGLDITGTPETASRLAEFAAVLHKQGWLDKVKQGQTPPMPVLVRAINAAHDVTVDFRRIGPWGRYLNYWLPFINANLEGIDKTVRTFRDNPSRTLMRVGMQIVPVALLYWWIRHDDDDYKERPEWQDRFWVFTDKEGKPLWRIPKPHTWGLLHSGIERMLDGMYDKDPEAVERWFKQALGTLPPDAWPVGATPLYETMFNYDHFRDQPIVSRRLQQYEGPEQYYVYTSSLAKHAAKFLYDHSGGKVKLSPAKIDHLADSLTGGLYKTVAAPVEHAVSGKPWELSDIPGLKGITLRKEYTKSIDDLYEAKESLAKYIKSREHLGEPVSGKDKSRLRRMERAARKISKLRKEVAELPANERNEHQRVMTGIARRALGKESLERYPVTLGQ